MNKALSDRARQLQSPHGSSSSRHSNDGAERHSSTENNNINIRGVSIKTSPSSSSTSPPLAATEAAAGASVSRGNKIAAN